MIQKALESDPLPPDGVGAKKAKKGAGKKKGGKKAKLDTETRFFNHYSENPHLQQIENGYLKYLEAQHAKESHLKAIKKFQILTALKIIQRYWRKKYLLIRERSARTIQKLVRHFLAKMEVYRGKLLAIRRRLLRHRLNSQLRLYIKKRRVGKGYLRPDILAQASDNMQAVLLI